MTVDALPAAPPRKRSPWSVRFLALAGFLLALAVGGLFISQQLAVERARTYLKSRYKTNLEVPVRDIRPYFVFQPASGNPAPPLGFCWTIEVETGLTRAEVVVNPWTHDVVDWNVDL